MPACKRCEQEIVVDVEQCPFCGSSQGEGNPQHEDLQREAMSLGARIAGAVLVLNAIFVFLGMFIAPGDGGPINPMGSAVVDLLLGGALLRGSVKYLKFVLIRVVLGFLLFSGIAIGQGDWLALGGQVALSMGLLLLLVGRPAAFRIAISFSLLGGYFLLALIGAQYLITGRSVLTPFLVNGLYELSPVDGSRIRFNAVPFSIGGLSDRWWLRSIEEAKRDNPVSDTWLVNRDYDAHIQVIAEQLDPNDKIATSDVSEFVVSGFQESLEEFRLGKKESIDVNGLPVDVVDVSGSVQNLSFRYRVGCFAGDAVAIQIICFAQESAFPNIAADCDAAIRSLAPDS